MTLVAALVGSIPSPSMNQLSIGPLHLRFYGLMIALGVIAGVWLLGKQLEQHRRGTADDASSIAIWGVIAGLIGARLYHVITDWSRFADDLGSIPKVWEGGLGIPGGLLLGIPVGAWQAKRRGIKPTVAMTFAAPAIALAQSIARWGNWFNQELFGRPTDLPWALRVDDEHLPTGYPPGTTFHPAFLYESIWNLVLCLVLLRIQRRFRLGAGPVARGVRDRVRGRALLDRRVAHRPGAHRRRAALEPVDGARGHRRRRDRAGDQPRQALAGRSARRRRRRADG